ncbi:MAG: hypothetical protein OXI17_09915 [Gammaproteobacteria bacterium]|nr:hypothetical protein [Gammaproteobacteria bacterium]
MPAQKSAKVAKSQQEEVDQNYEAFVNILPDLIKTNANRFALMHDREVVACFDTSRDAIEAGKKLFNDSFFSVQEVTRRSVNLGFFSHASSIRTF